jgi:hypothetical protein
MPFPDKARIPYIAARPALPYAARRRIAGAETSYGTGWNVGLIPAAARRGSHRQPTADPAHTL